jgi:transposase
MVEKRTRREFSEEFKNQVVSLYNIGNKTKAEIIRDYDLTPSSFARWLKNINGTGSTKAKDNRSVEETRLLDLLKENKQLKMENDILKQAALIMAKK